jgi:hypothetical protein
VNLLATSALPPAGLRYSIQGNRVQTQRWGDQTDEKTFALIPFGGHLKEERRFDDYTIPTQVSVGCGSTWAISGPGIPGKPRPCSPGQPTHAPATANDKA